MKFFHIRIRYKKSSYIHNWNSNFGANINKIILNNMIKMNNYKKNKNKYPCIIIEHKVQEEDRIV